uniref:Replication protein A C-terminal domain-containing protein n=1 Tax=Saimiri boliviensis boliviensis TaxID=39432 RepID=A0A2K6SQV6_SAIBB
MWNSNDGGAGRRRKRIAGDFSKRASLGSERREGWERSWGCLEGQSFGEPAGFSKACEVAQALILLFKAGGFESYGSSNYGGAGGYTQSPGGFGSPGPSQAEKKSRARAQHIVPCTISQLLSATLVDEVFRIGNVEISQVTIVGIIRHTEKAPTNIVYKIDDMTAPPMDVRQWVDTDVSGSSFQSFAIIDSNKKSLVAFKIMPLEDMNEFTAHILEVINAHMILSKGSSQSLAPGPQVYTPIAVYCPHAVDFLSNEGHIYSTVDDDHFKSTDAE